MRTFKASGEILVSFFVRIISPSSTIRRVFSTEYLILCRLKPANKIRELEKDAWSNIKEKNQYTWGSL